MKRIEEKVRSFEEIDEKLPYLRQELKDLENARGEIRQWLYQRIKRFSPKELFKFKLVDEIMEPLTGNKTVAVEEAFKFLSENRDANEEDIRHFLQTFRGNGEEMKFHCPYCTNEIDPEVTECPSCGAAYGPDTIQSLKITFEKSDQEDSNKQDNATKEA